MAENSYPFEADNANGGKAVVSQAQWQSMMAQALGDRTNLPLPAGSYSSGDLPFRVSVTSSRKITVTEGTVTVGGFFYELTEPMTLTVADNPGGNDRKDLLVVRLDMAKSAANMTILQGTAAASPVEPQPRRQPGGIWEFPIMAINAPAKNGAVTVASRVLYPMPAPVTSPWNTKDSAYLAPKHGFVYDLDGNLDTGKAIQVEFFNGASGPTITRDLTYTRAYTPSILGTSSLPASYRSGRWRWIAPGIIWFSAQVKNANDGGAMLTGSNWRAGITLPVAANANTQIVHGYVANSGKSGNLPNMMSVTASTTPNSTALNLMVPSPTTPTGGLDGMPGFPGNSQFFISGVIETNTI
ncbi:hypothetical protein [Streptomyces sp. Tu6071]|uniref:hypothetical protein n=1 Tax=Streptomyces sp. Tu6071 TaxID=355249 RepID=UPI0005BA7015|nr:hypothetical protein [Streptomyces sp. Tu6071]